ncbi:MAG: hypothetical protein ACRYFK_02345 [Janthinobacterium lividum]
MQTSALLTLGIALAGLALSRPALAQTAVPTTGAVSDATTIPRIPTAAVPGDPGATVSPNANGKLNTLFPNGVPKRDIDAGNSRAAQPRSGQAMPGAQPTKSIFKKRS